MFENVTDGQFTLAASSKPMGTAMNINRAATRGEYVQRKTAGGKGALVPKNAPSCHW